MRQQCDPKYHIWLSLLRRCLSITINRWTQVRILVTVVHYVFVMTFWNNGFIFLSKISVKKKEGETFELQYRNNKIVNKRSCFSVTSFKHWSIVLYFEWVTKPLWLINRTLEPSKFLRKVVFIYYPIHFKAE